jgi:hypothetical protein
MFKTVGILEYYLSENVGFLGESWKNKGSGLAVSAKTYIQNFITKFKDLFCQRI